MTKKLWPMKTSKMLTNILNLTIFGVLTNFAKNSKLFTLINLPLSKIHKRGQGAHPRISAEESHQETLTLMTIEGTKRM